MRRLFLPLLSLLFLLSACGRAEPLNETLEEKSNLLWKQVQQSWEDPGFPPAGDAGYVVFFSASDGKKRASVRYARGDTLRDAWEGAVEKINGVVESPIWVKTDIVSECSPCSASQLSQQITQSQDWYFREGISFDPTFETALLEEELNGSSILNYDYGDFDVDFLQDRLKENGLKQIKSAPAGFYVFHCKSWFCDENNNVSELSADQINQGQRKIEELDGDFARQMIEGAASYLASHVLEDGRFVYDYYPQYDMSTDSYNIIRHAGTIWAMAQSYRLFPSDALKNSILLASDYLVSMIAYDVNGAGFLLNEEDGEYELGGNGLAVLALSEVDDVLGEERYKEDCLSLGDGILFMQNPETGRFNHILNLDFTVKEQFHTEFYDGEGTYALARLYGLTKDERWLKAATEATDYFIADNYDEKYCDHWQAYSINEITKYITDNPVYWDYAMRLVTNHGDDLAAGSYTSPVYLEMTMNVFETYTRRPDCDSVPREELEVLFKAIKQTAKQQSNNFFFAEFVMYMAKPQEALNTFFARDDLRIRIDDVQHNIGGYYLYQKDYDSLLDCGFEPFGV